MTEQQIDELVWKQDVRIVPAPRLYKGGRNGSPLPSRDVVFRVGQREAGFVYLHSTTHHCLKLRIDEIGRHKSDPTAGEGYGRFFLRSQVGIGGDHIWSDPIVPQNTQRFIV